MIQIKTIRTWEDFQKNTKQYIEELNKSGNPEILTVNGKPELIVQDAQAYQHLLDRVERLEMIEGIKKGLKDLQEGKTHPAKDAHTELRSLE